MRKYILIAFVGMLAMSCAKVPTACVTADSNVGSVGDTIRFTSCSEGATDYEWRINEQFPNTIEGSLTSNHHVIDGSGGITCDTYIDVVFNTAGTYNLKLITPLLKSGSCSSSTKTWSKETEATTTVVIQ